MIFVLAVAALAAADLLIKAYINRHAGELEGKEIAGGNARIHLLYNGGFAGNRMENKPRLVKGVTVGSSAAFAVFFLVMLRARGQYFLKACMAAAFGGALGNTIERLHRGKVTDYLQPQIKGKKGKYVYNFADILITVGSVGGILAIIKDLISE